MRRSVLAAALAACLVTAGSLPAWGADLKVVQTRKTREAVITVLSETGRLTGGSNRVVVQLSAPDSDRPLEATSLTFSAGMSMPGMSPMSAGASLTREAPGRYAGTIAFEHGGTWQVTVSWEGPGGRGSARFPVSVR